jgi:hypothetical protein
VKSLELFCGNLSYFLDFPATPLPATNPKNHRERETKKIFIIFSWFPLLPKSLEFCWITNQKIRDHKITKFCDFVIAQITNLNLWSPSNNNLWSSQKVASEPKTSSRAAATTGTNIKVATQQQQEAGSRSSRAAAQQQRQQRHNNNSISHNGRRRRR